MRRLCQLFTFVVLSGLLALPAAAAELRLPDGQGLIPADAYVEILIEQADEGLTPEQVMAPALAARWKAYPGKKINLPGERRPVWVRLSLRQDGGSPASWVLGTEWPLLDRVDFHLFDPEHGRWLASHQGGFKMPHEPGAAKGPVPAFPFILAPGQRVTVVLRTHSDSQLRAPLRLLPAADWQARRYDNGVAMGLLFGILGVMFFYNLCLYGFTRDASYGAYTAYVLTIIAYELTGTGLGPLYVWAGSPWLKTHAYEFFAACSFLAATWFFRVFLKLWRAAPHLNRMNQGFLVFWTAMVPLMMFKVPVLGLILSLGGILVGFVAIYTAGYLVRQGNVLARYLLIAWLAIIAATFVTLLSLIGVIDGGPWIDHSQHVGFVIETVLLSMALAERIRRDRLSKQAAQRQALALALKVDQEREEKIHAQEHALEVQLKANEELELRVLDRTAELERAMESVASANRALARLSVTDGLTKVHNRRYFDEVLRKEFDRSARTQSPLALLLADIDHFKKINDTAGHLAGDECLRLVAAAISACVGRSTDLVARFGGEEFAIVLPATDVAQALEVAERIRHAVEGIEFVYRGRRVPLSISLGVVARVTDAHRPLAEFIREADQALYAAKAAGRNQAMLATA